MGRGSVPGQPPLYPAIGIAVGGMICGVIRAMVGVVACYLLR
jgi:hypothetical protein